MSFLCGLTEQELQELVTIEYCLIHGYSENERSDLDRLQLLRDKRNKFCEDNRTT